MKILGVIPARRGSQRIKYKAMRRLASVPLIKYTIMEAKKSHLDMVLVSSDFYEVLQLAQNLGVMVHHRPPYLAGKKSPIYDTLILICEEYPGMDWIMLLNPTCPLRTSADIDNVISMIQTGSRNLHAIVSVRRDYGFWWHGKQRIYELPRTRTQDAHGYYVENGAIFAMDRYTLAQGDIVPKNSKNVKMYVMPSDRSVDIDTIFDAFLAECIIKYWRK